MRTLASWLARHFLLFLLLAAAIALFQSGVLTRSCTAPCDTASVGDWDTASEVEYRLQETVRQSRRDLEDNLSRFGDWSATERRAEIERRRRRLDDIRDELERETGLLDRYRPGTVVERHRLGLERIVLEREIAVLEAQLDLDALQEADPILVPTPTAIARAREACRDANRAVRAFNENPMAAKWVRNRIADEADRLTDQAQSTCERAKSLAESRQQGLEQADERARLMREARRSINDRITLARSAVTDAQTPEVRNMIADIAAKAALALLVIIATPFVIRAFLYFVLAPLAAMRGAIRIPALAGAGGTIPIPDPSRVSIPVRLQEGEELLVRQSYLQTSPGDGNKATRWLLDYRHPLSSIASGLVFLTRIAGTEEASTISATRDGFAELTAIELAQGSACILHPRALAAVIQPAGRPIAIRSHWRLFSLNAWLTLQLRFFSFHGPGRLIVKGGRGIRVERADKGRIFAQDQLVGFSADLAYSVTRTETFAPYFFGREPLLKDKVEGGGGVLVIEEAPLSMRGNGQRRGLEGLIDAGMKAFGL